MRADVCIEHAGMSLHAGVDRLSPAGIQFVHGDSQRGQFPAPFHGYSQLAAVGAEPRFTDKDVIQTLAERAPDVVVANGGQLSRSYFAHYASPFAMSIARVATPAGSGPTRKKSGSLPQPRDS